VWLSPILLITAAAFAAAGAALGVAVVVIAVRALSGRAPRE